LQHLVDRVFRTIGETPGQQCDAVGNAETTKVVDEPGQPLRCADVP
jgi:hypothetical protein